MDTLNEVMDELLIDQNDRLGAVFSPRVDKSTKFKSKFTAKNVVPKEETHDIKN